MCELWTGIRIIVSKLVSGEVARERDTHTHTHTQKQSAADALIL